MNLSNKFTLIIPTFNRHSYVKRSIDYYVGAPFSVIYLDSSEESIENQNFKKNIHYIHCPKKGFVKKIHTCLENINTKYVALCADDDFIPLDSIKFGLKFLEDNNSFKTVQGLNVGFLNKFNGEFYYSNNIQSYDANEINFGLIKNAEIFWQNYRNVLWSLQHRDNLLVSFDILSKKKIINDNYIEFVIGCIACAQGGIKYIDKIWNVRERFADDHWAHRHKSIKNFYINSETRKEFKHFEKIIDNQTIKGYSKHCLKNYLKFTVLDIAKQIFKQLLLNFHLIQKYPKTNTNSNLDELVRLEFKKYPHLKNIKKILEQEYY
ncbi:MAG: TIGR00180 family glycosyltransferase [Candidatus Marinimicrobia bacterium]|nr:TIGR00180 family glycosyltransferase [Candidatus Neomarinimicrobiota bacterium]MCF7828742.1 TIGR00180 family glycosyltransferase [Candidatus Neomarinimicrobiota bacterium]MCF7880659.1 TIGR00180 family glycosyltransferase [Candidatus Neomarinimicrobiota bacterium]